MAWIVYIRYSSTPIHDILRTVFVWVFVSFIVVLFQLEFSVIIQQNAKGNGQHLRKRSFRATYSTPLPFIRRNIVLTTQIFRDIWNYGQNYMRPNHSDAPWSRLPMPTWPACHCVHRRYHQRKQNAQCQYRPYFNNVHDLTLNMNTHIF